MSRRECFGIRRDRRGNTTLVGGGPSTKMFEVKGTMVFSSLLTTDGDAFSVVGPSLQATMTLLLL